MNNPDRSQHILALRDEGRFYASGEERQKYLAEEWSPTINPETGIALVAVNGPTHGSSFWGAGSYSRLSAIIESMLSNEAVKTIVVAINSPGGDVNGLFECCSYLAKAKETKPIHAHVTGMCCSAAFAIASSCTDISATDTSEIGSVGVYAEAWDDSEWMKKNGILAKIFRSKNAEKKNQSPFSEEGAADLQAKLDYYEDCFYSVLSEGRGMEKEKCVENFGHGSVFMASEALKRNMIDSIQSYDELINTLLASSETDEEEAEGDDMDITAMSAEERRTAFEALVQAEPSLLAEVEGRVRASERERISALNAERNESNAAIVDKAIAEGTELSAIAMDLYKAEKEASAKRAEEAKNLALIHTQAENTQEVVGLQNPTPNELASFDRLVARVNEDVKEKN